MHSDATRLARLLPRAARRLANLVTNAIKFTRSGGRITLSATADAEAVHLIVSDTGPGIAPEHLPHIFERFWHARGTSHVRGSGLGLAIVRGIVEAHAGRIAVDSAPGRGTRFTIALPRASAVAERAGRAKAQVLPTPVAHGA